MNQQEQRIRELAYEIWLSEGRPEGQDARHWEMACKLAEAQNGTAPAKPAGRTRKTATKPTDATPAKSAGSAQGTKPAKAATAAKGSARATSRAATDAQAGTPDAIKKTRTSRSAKTTER
ncbi:DUF2934 domain-containing protein [Stutzerimonas nitrititolerans]|uniref:DUF2934 domain-containing protein n=1 Tax=Stutzerimonas nitrititolerans TaxID=2482751 RepID=UPI001481FE16|nr:DUF2934 domain-containing protein [Stutzerimonas nitrititolerans]NNT94719.1 DUF2934 domain-containing protein [Stutzerimonas nitrititolerans]